MDRIEGETRRVARERFSVRIILLVRSAKPTASKSFLSFFNLAIAYGSRQLIEEKVNGQTANSPQVSGIRRRF